MKTPGWCVLTAASIIAGALVTTGCDKFDRFHNVEWRKTKYINSGKKYMTEKKYADAKIQFMRAAAMDPNWSEAQYQLGLASLGTHEAPRAYKSFQKAVAINPKNTSALQEMATLELLNRRYEDAKNNAEKILAIQPGNFAAEETMAYALAGLGDMEGAEGELATLVEHDPGALEADLNLVRMKLREKDKPGAEAVLVNAANKAPTASSWTLLANFYLLEAKAPEAEAAYRKAVTLE